jgi:hypothetical protein
VRIILGHGVIAFHEKAGRSQVVLLSLDKVFFLAE